MDLAPSELLTHPSLTYPGLAPRATERRRFAAALFLRLGLSWEIRGVRSGHLDNSEFRYLIGTMDSAAKPPVY
jgi:hypothetical protein